MKKYTITYATIMQATGGKEGIKKKKKNYTPDESLPLDFESCLSPSSSSANSSRVTNSSMFSGKSGSPAYSTYRYMCY